MPLIPLKSYGQLRKRLQNELSVIPVSLRADFPPTVDEQRTLRTRVAYLEDLLDEVDAVPFDALSDEGDVSRHERRELVTDIVAAIDDIERRLQPNTPTESPMEGTHEGDAPEEDEDEEKDLFDGEIQRVIQETLARKMDDDGGEATNKERSSVTVEDVPDLEY
jgi:hypothetical protein